jgi:putative cardiolipin synthase
MQSFACATLAATICMTIYTGPQPMSFANCCRPLVLILSVGLVLAGCASVPLDTPKTPTYALVDTQETLLAKDAADWLSEQPGTNGFYPLSQGLDAFGARLALIGAAERSIDAQYFLMKPDSAGLVFGEKLLAAADRGVRVRFLLDDIFTTVSDKALATLDAHPNIELRIFNPISRKGSESLNYLGNFSLANRRMHNKSLTMDNVVAVVGGRNIAEEYFQLEESGEFIDFDMLVAGPIVQAVSASFDDYWNHALAVPFDVLYRESDPEKIAQNQTILEQLMADKGNEVYSRSISTELMQAFFAGTLPPYHADATFFADTPQKLLEKVSDDQKILAANVRQALSEAEKEIIIFTPYFIPRKAGIEFIEQLRAKGVRITILTNSLATNNHTSVHSSYASYRKDVLRAGVELWEARSNAVVKVNADGEEEVEQLTLHTKGILIDRRKIFVGSLNLDPRSIDINTEMGVLIDSPELAALLSDNAHKLIPTFAWRLELGDNNKITWHADIAGEGVVTTKEPLTSGWKRFQAWFLKIAPESQL